MMRIRFLRLFSLALVAIAYCSSWSACASGPLAIDDSALGLSAQNISRLRQSVLMMKDSSANSYCTVFPVSRDGYLLTALHCLRSCLSENGWSEEAGNRYLDLSELFIVKNPRPRNALCANLSVPALGVDQGVQVVATGPALALYGPRFLLEFTGLYRELQEKGWNRKSNDFALLKVNPGAELRCLRLHTKSPEGAQALLAVGYPLPKVRNTEPVLSASLGHRFGRLEQSKFYQSQRSGEDQQWVREQLLSSGLIFADAANTFGQSGGPVIDPDGAVIGITSGFENPLGSTSEDQHELVAVSIRNVLRELPRDLALDLVRRNTLCAP